MNTTPNLCPDRTLRRRRVHVAGIHRSDATGVTASGKGVNGTRVLLAHGDRPVIAGLVPSDDGALLEGLPADEGARLVGVEGSGSTRIVTILAEDGGRVT